MKYMYIIECRDMPSAYWIAYHGIAQMFHALTIKMT